MGDRCVESLWVVGGGNGGGFGVVGCRRIFKSHDSSSDYRVRKRNTERERERILINCEKYFTKKMLTNLFTLERKNKYIEREE